MALKKDLLNKNENEQATSNENKELATVVAGLPANLSGSTNVTLEEFLPRLKVVYPIEVDPAKGILPKHGYQTMIQAGESYIEVPDNTHIMGITGRPCAKSNTVEIGGVKVKYDEKNEEHKKIGAKFEMVYGPLKGQTPSKKYEDALKDPLFERGISWLVAVFLADGCMVAELNGFKSMSTYWSRPLLQGCLDNRQTVLLKQSNHCYNLKSGKNYLDPKKFNQYEICQLTSEQGALLAGAIEASQPKIDGWLKK